jgi:REP element-mobilizing transposase RayT
MSNVHRLRTSDRVFFITTNLNQGERPFRDVEYAIILETIAKSRTRLGFLFCGYVLMPDHWHALISTVHPLTISDVLQDIKRLASIKINKLRKTKGSRWQHQFWDRFVRHSKEFVERLEYMHYNPVRKGLVERPEQWRWSSVNNFSLDKSVVAACPIQIDYVQLPDNYRA